MTWLSIDGADNKKNGRAVYVAAWHPAGLVVCTCTLEEAQRWADPPSHVVVERTQADGRLGRSETTPKVMVGMAWNTSAIAYTLARGAPVHEYSVSDCGDEGVTTWIGGVSKNALHSRIWSALTPAERAVVASFGRKVLGPRKRGPAGSGRVEDVTNAVIHNNVRAATGRDLLKHDWYDVLDAVGVGLFHLGRVGKGAAPIRRAAKIGAT